MNHQYRVRVVLASSSPGRKAILRGAGIDPDVVPPDVDESAMRSTLEDGRPGEVVVALAEAKAKVVEKRLLATGELANSGENVATIIIGCDSMLELAGRLIAKPSTPKEAMANFALFSGKAGCVHTGQHVILLTPVAGLLCRQQLSAVSDTDVQFATLTPGEIRAYVATGEPLNVAGCTVEGIGGAFLSFVRGDPHGVGGLSLTLLRQMILDLGLDWPSLWNRGSWLVRDLTSN